MKRLRDIAWPRPRSSRCASGRVGPVLDDGRGDRERIDLIRLARLALPAPGAHHVRRQPGHPLTPRRPASTGSGARRAGSPRSPTAAPYRARAPIAPRPDPRLLILDLALSANPVGPVVHRRPRVAS